MEQEALKLWIEWFERNGNPFASGNDLIYCLFCDGESQHESSKFEHEEDCIYIRAKKLIELR